MKSHVQAGEAQRLQALQACLVLNMQPEDVFDEIVAEAAAVTGCPLAALTFVDDHRTWVKAATQNIPHIYNRAESFCTYGILEPRLLEVCDAACDERFVDIPAVKTGEIKYYAGAQVHSSDGLALGMLCVTHNTQYQLTPLQRRQLTDLAARVSALLELRAA